MKVQLLLAALVVAGGTIDSGWPPSSWTDDNTVTTHFTNQAGVDRLCGKAPPGYRTLGCSYRGKREIVLPNPCSGEFGNEDFAKLVCHELAHANGWPGDHPRP
jgi:hypothetical protein